MAESKNEKNEGVSDARMAATLATIRDWSEQQHRVPAELATLQRSLRAETKLSQDRLLDRLAHAAGVDLEAILEEPRRRNRAKRRAVTRVVKRVRAEVKERAAAARERWGTERKEHLDRYREYYAKRAGNPWVMFARPIDHWFYAPPTAGCSSMRCGADNFGSFENTADMLVSDTTDGTNMNYLRPYIECSNGDCEESEVVRTIQDLTFVRPSPVQNMWVEQVSVDLWGSGAGMARVGDKGPGVFTRPNPAFTHSLIEVTLSVWQETPTGVRGPWVVLDRHPIWERAGDYAEPIMIEQSTVATTHRHVDLHGLGDERMDYRLYCHLRLECSALAQGTDGYALLDFRSEGLGMQLGCIVLSGAVI